jgi:hypothetical protein
MRAQFKVVLEALQNCPTRAEMNGRFEQVDVRLARLETEVRGVREDLAGKAQASLLVALDQRVGVLERRLG